MNKDYYDRVWRQKLTLSQYATLESRWRTRWDFALLETPAGSRVLDAGCGDGVLGELLQAKRRCRVYGLDISGEALCHAGKRAVLAAQSDISRHPFPFPEESFDVVTLLCSLEHIFDPARALRESARVLRRDGRVLVTLPNAAHFRVRWHLARGRLSRELLHTRDGEGLHVRFFNYLDDFEALVYRDVVTLDLVEKRAALKHPSSYSRPVRFFLEIGLRLRPNLFAEYVHYILERNR